MDQVLQEIRTDHPTATRIVWIGLREEPVVYVNSEPYCLRREKFSLRNMKGAVVCRSLLLWLTSIRRLWRHFRFQIGGVRRTPQGRRYRRTQRLRRQVGSFILLPPIILNDNRLLLHTETQDGSVVPIWEDARPETISVMKETMASRKHLAEGVELAYARIPITAEKVPDFVDLSELIDVVIRTHASDTPIVLNCQLGRGRSTLTSVS